MKSTCPSCGKRVVCKDELAGKKARCPQCREPFILTETKAPNLAAGVEETKSEKIPTLVVSCARCFKELTVEVTQVGKRMGCPHCKKQFTVRPDFLKLPPHVFSMAHRVQFPPLCICCMGANPSKSLAFRAKPEFEQKWSLGAAFGSIAGGIIGAALTGNVVGAALGQSAGAELGDAKLRRNVGMTIPICETCLAGLPDDEVRAFDETSLATPFSAMTHLRRQFEHGVVILQIANPKYAQAFRELNAGKVFDSINQCTQAQAGQEPPRLLFEPPGSSGEFLLKVLDKLLPTDGAAGWYRAPNIPPKKVANALATYAVKIAEEDILGLGDETVFGSSKAGFVLAKAGIQFKIDSASGIFSFANVREAVLSKGLITTSVDVCLNDGRIFTLVHNLTKKIAPSLSDMINQMALYHRLRRDSLRNLDSRQIP